MKTFFGGIRPNANKDLTKDKPIKVASIPKEVIIPLSQHVGVSCQPRVEVGDRVKVGTKIGESDQYLSSPIHASISGTVKKIEDLPHPVIGMSPAIVIESDGKDEKDSSIGEETTIEGLSPDEVRQIVRDAGIVGLGGGAFPTHVKLNLPKDKPIDSFILNGAECEPYLTCDHRMMIEYPDEIIQGINIIMMTLGARNGYIGIEQNLQDAIELMEAKIRGDRRLKVIGLSVKYPQGAEKQLIKVILNREVPSGGLPYEVGVVVHNIGTILAVYEAVRFGKPLYERVITVCGSPIRDPQNLRVRIGTPFSHLIDECGGLSRKPLKIVMGGPMMGLSQCDLRVPVVKGTSGVIFLAEDEVTISRDWPCIRCGKCVDVCPIRLVPSQICLAAEKEDFGMAERYGVLDCIECGACAYICPAKRPLVHLIQFAKSQLVLSQKK